MDRFFLGQAEWIANSQSEVTACFSFCLLLIQHSHLIAQSREKLKPQLQETICTHIHALHILIIFTYMYIYLMHGIYTQDVVYVILYYREKLFFQYMGLLHFCMLLTIFKNTFQIFFEESLRQCESISKMFILGEISHAQKSQILL